MDIDFHTHILPQCDHGSNSLQNSLKQIELAKSAGVDIICATPHFYPQRENLDEFLERRKNCYESFKPYLTETRPRILLGAEVLICDSLEKMDGLEQLCLEGTNLLLLEMPFNLWTSRNFETVQAIEKSRDIKVVLAHIERYKKSDVKVLTETGVKVQINVKSLCSWRNSHYFKRLMADGAVYALGSDIHGLSGYEKWNRCRKKFGDSWKMLMSNVENELENYVYVG